MALFLTQSPLKAINDSDGGGSNLMSSLFSSKDYGTSKATLEGGNAAANEINRDTSWLSVGGAFRTNYIFTDYESGTSPLGTDSRHEWTWDTWRINVDAYNQGLQLSFEYRFYPTFNTHFIKYGWIGYRFDHQNNLQMGIVQVPFGLLTYASHSWWFQLPYYVGLEDDHQMGFNYTRESDDWTLNLAYFLHAEPRGTSEAGFGPFSAARYSYDVVPTADGNTNIERHQINLRAARNIGAGELGISLQTHQVYNQVTEHTGNQYAIAGHYEGTWGNWGLKAQAIYYNFDDVRDDADNELSYVQMGAYGFGTYDVAAEAALYSIGLSYNFPVEWGPISNIQVYNDYTLMQKFNELDFEETEFKVSQQNVLGALVTAGSIFAYFDVAMGSNHPWLTEAFGGNALGTGRGENFREPVTQDNPLDDDPGWNVRFNINLGYYF